MKILVVDDDRSLRESTARLLRACGHETATADCPETALVLVRTDHFDFVITDLNMPAPNCASKDEGLLLIPEIRTASPQTQILLVSGDMCDTIATRAVAAGAIAGISKPYTFDKLRELGIIPTR